MPQTPNDWNTYLSQLDIGDPTLAAYLRSALPTLVDAVPPAGQYTTSLDYTTLKPALSAQYVGEVIQKYEAMLGPVPELYQAAVASGALTQEQADAMAQQSATGVGTLQQQYASHGGLRALAGPYNAARTELLQQALADIQTAAQKASTDAYQLSSTTTGQRVTALSNAGGLGTQLVGQGVSRRNAQTAAEAGGEGPGFDIPQPPNAPHEPSLWEKLLLAGIPALAAGGLGVAGRLLAPSPDNSPGAKAEKDAEYAAARQRFEDARTTPYDQAARDIVAQGSQGPQSNVSSPYSTGYSAPGYSVAGAAPTMTDLGLGNPFSPQTLSGGGGGGGYSAPGYSVAPSYSWSQPLPDFTPSSSYTPQPSSYYQSYNPMDYYYAGSGGGSSPYTGDYGYSNPSGYANDYGYSGSSFDYSGGTNPSDFTDWWF